MASGARSTAARALGAVRIATIARALGAAGVATIGFAIAASEGATPAAHTVTIDGFAFKPPTITVRAGESVEWRNTDPVPHTATAKDAGLDSGEIAANGTFRFTAKKKGRFPYLCTLHPIMKGEIVVD